jgi:hypothetical protein
MMKNIPLLITLVVVCILAGCAGKDEPRKVPETTVQQAAVRATQFKSTLMTSLMEGMLEGPEHAIGVCSVVAPELAEELSVDGVRIGRTSLRLRNPANSPEDWMRPLLEHYTVAGPGAEPRSVWVDDTTVGYVEPLYVGRPCLTCHGETVAESVREQIEELYPDDRSVGFREGDFRGLLWVTIEETGG